MSNATTQIDATVLVVLHEPIDGDPLTDMLRRGGARVVTCSRAADAFGRLNAEPIDVVIVDQVLADTTGLALVADLERQWPGIPVVMIADDASPETVRAALQAGAIDVLQRPLDAEQVSFVLAKTLAAAQSHADRPISSSSGARTGPLGKSPAMRQVLATLARAASGTSTVLVRGESGTGKEVVARALHDKSPRAKQPFFKIDCASLPENLLDSELFGYEKGAFTGATSRKPGRVELADKGTLFLDEIGELGLPLQAKLLRLLQDRQFERLGGTKTLRVDVRVVAATHRDLETMIEKGHFRLDLFYRLNVIPLWLPPLRARREDIELLAAHFCETLAAANGREGMTIAPEAMRFLRSQRWPGNVRQLQNFVERLVVLADQPIITLDAVQAEVTNPVAFETQPGSMTPGMLARRADAEDDDAPASETGAVMTLSSELKAAEKKALERALRSAKGNRSIAARLLNISRSTLYAKLQEHGLL